MKNVLFNGKFKFPFPQTLSLILIVSVLLMTGHVHAAGPADAGLSPEQGETVPVAFTMKTDRGISAVKDDPNNPINWVIDYKVEFTLKLKSNNIVIVDWNDPSGTTTTESMTAGQAKTFTFTYPSSTYTVAAFPNKPQIPYTIDVKTCGNDIVELTAGNQELVEVGMIDQLTGLEKLGLSNNDIAIPTELDLTACSNLKDLFLTANEFEYVDVQNLQALRDVRMERCKLKGANSQTSPITYDFTSNPALQNLILRGSNSIKKIVLGNPNLTMLSISGNPLQGDILLKDCPKLEVADLDYTSHGTGINLHIGTLPVLRVLRLSDSFVLNDLNLNNCPKLEYLGLSDSQPANSCTKIKIETDQLENLYYVHIAQCTDDIIDLSKASKIEFLKIRKSTGADLKVPNSMPYLQHLYITNTPNFSLNTIDKLIDATPFNIQYHSFHQNPTLPKYYPYFWGHYYYILIDPSFPLLQSQKDRIIERHVLGPAPYQNSRGDYLTTITN